LYKKRDTIIFQQINIFNTPAYGQFRNAHYVHNIMKLLHLIYFASLKQFLSLVIIFFELFHAPTIVSTHVKLMLYFIPTFIKMSFMLCLKVIKSLYALKGSH
jgi:hypothetical protein